MDTARRDEIRARKRVLKALEESAEWNEHMPIGQLIASALGWPDSASGYELGRRLVAVTDTELAAALLKE